MHSTLSTVDFNRFKNVNNGLSKKNFILFFLSLEMLRMTAWKWKLSPSKLTNVDLTIRQLDLLDYFLVTTM